MQFNHLLTYNAGDNAQCGWDCKNGDLLKVIVQWVASHPAFIHFTHVCAHSCNAHNNAAGRVPLYLYHYVLYHQSEN
ncbi:hypothetical protein EV368DRAFT_47781 [Lentinula lateritia]|uniref:Uncharacterized protein n=1 Tax=Lentinula aff. lateritia TaxID=2804960 RepID=A0ACC1TJG5_9AGAR|nr:hypothetical protein F5876DRAFT_52997 [Lentinula aff. lateritia]KAJ3849200.1 hypothetical protein EV368DRAFT_47781 [Lentinula lateritia]